MKLRFTLFPHGKVEYYCELEVPESDLNLEAAAFADRYLAPCATALLGPFEEPFPTDPEEVLAMLNRGGPERALKFYHAVRPH
jgi:hypothetical protein